MEQVNILLGMDCYFLIRVKVVNVENYCNCFRMNLRQEGQDTCLHSGTFLDTIHQENSKSDSVQTWKQSNDSSVEEQK